MPQTIDRRALGNWLGEQEGVRVVHDLVIWALSPTRTALAVHLVREGGDTESFLERVTDGLEDNFGIGYVTLQLELVPRKRVDACHFSS